MTTTEHPESFKANLQSSARAHRPRPEPARPAGHGWRPYGAVPLVGMVPRWRANASLVRLRRVINARR